MESFVFGAIFGSSFLWVQQNKRKLHPAVKDILQSYGKWAISQGSNSRKHAIKLGYIDYIDFLPDNIWNGFCGSGCPMSISQPNKGDFVVDLGSGLGGDSLIYSKLVGDTGQVFGLDLVPEMITNARALAKSLKVTNVKYMEEKIDDSLQSRDLMGCADFVSSNGVLNLCINKKQACRNAFDLLKPGGKFVFSDVFKIETR